ncbi:MAG: M23 family metallopeptidase [Flavisolibacter sp.]
MQLVANFGEIRPNHWHMGLDISTRHRENLPVLAAAEGYIGRVSVEPGGFGQAVYIIHPNGFTTVYGHLNAFFPALASYVKQQQYKLSSWQINLRLPTGLFKVKKGEPIGLSGSTGGSEGPHLHFEIRNSETDNNLNPLLFGFPIPDHQAPKLLRLALYDRSKTTYAGPQRIYSLKKSGDTFRPVASSLLKINCPIISFAIQALDYFPHSRHSGGIYTGRMAMDGKAVSEFVLDNISYDKTRYLNAHIDYPFKSKTKGNLQHLSPLSGEQSGLYHTVRDNGLIFLKDHKIHKISIEISDASQNKSTLSFAIQAMHSDSISVTETKTEKLLPHSVNAVEKESFELFTSEKTMYDTVAVDYQVFENKEQHAVSAVYSFLDASIPVHDSILVRIKPSIPVGSSTQNRLIIKNISGKSSFVQKARWQKGWVSAHFRQFGTYQVFIDEEPPTISELGSDSIIDLTRSSEILISAKDNFNAVRNFRAELDGQWLCFSNDKGRAWIYHFDEYFLKGVHTLTVRLEDEAGNIANKKWRVRR